MQVPEHEKVTVDAKYNPSHIIPNKLNLQSKIQFCCHPGIRCFTACCRDITIILTPYDILSLIRRLHMTPPEFLHHYAEPTFLAKTDMVGVKIKMDAVSGKCPFVTENGCTVYSDRPTACRYYPVGMADFHQGGEENLEEEEFFFLVKEEHCAGFAENRQWTIAEWRADQGVDVRDAMNKEWLRLIMRRKSFGLQASLSEQAKRMFFMASTDLASFRRFIFESSFLTLYDLDDATKQDIENDDVALMHFSFRYLLSVLFGVDTIPLCQQKVQDKVKELKVKQKKDAEEALQAYEELKKERLAKFSKEEGREPEEGL